jgi:hypothetical protein
MPSSSISPYISIGTNWALVGAKVLPVMAGGSVGVREGLGVVGLAVGAAVVGLAVGAGVVGLAVGVAHGCCVGCALGCPEGELVGVLGIDVG